MARLLLDTHVVLWSLSDPDRLGPTAREAIVGPQNAMLVSAASVWEMAIKAALGKLSMPGDLPASSATPGSTGSSWRRPSPRG